ncbi:MAG: hypothetical protein ABI440_06670 [Casimicrobiaceae bacterium]
MKIEAQVPQDVLAELKPEPSFNASKMDVEIMDGIVTLADGLTLYRAS